jgi:hypothetical protein
MLQRASSFEENLVKRFFDPIVNDVDPKFKADAEKLKECFLDSDPYKSMAARFTRLWPNGTRRVTRSGGAYKNPTVAQQRTVDAWEGAVCGSVYNDLEGKRMPCTLGPLDFFNRFVPIAENEDEDEDDSETEDGAEKDTKKSKMNPLFAEADHCHVPVWPYAKLIVKVLEQGWLPALLYEEKFFRAMIHFMFSFDKPEDVNADFVRGLGIVFMTTRPVQFKHHVCHKEDRHHGDMPFPPLENLLGFSLAQAKLWLETHPPCIVPPEPPARQAFKTRRRR